MDLVTTLGLVENEEQTVGSFANELIEWDQYLGWFLVVRKTDLIAREPTSFTG